MIVHHISTNQSSTLNMANSLEKWVIDAAATISQTTDNGVSQASQFHDDILVVKGTISQTVGHFFGIAILGSRSDVDIAGSGSVLGYGGIRFLHADHCSLTNDGALTGSAYGAVDVQFCKDFTMENHGAVNGEIVVDRSTNVHILLAADGSLTSTGSTMDIASDAGQSARIVNEGQISSNSWAFYGRAGNETLINHGNMVGGINFGEGDDVFDTRGGKVHTTIEMDGGDDLVLLSKSSQEVYEYADDGTDTIKAACSYHLADNSSIEFLRLIGKGDFNATGNTLDSHIFGNGGANRLSGMEGDDVLDGGGGGDTFVFKTGFGHDRVSVFVDGTDKVDLSGLAGVKNFTDMMAHHVSTAGDDLKITDGSDILTLSNTTKSDLHSGDFLF